MRRVVVWGTGNMGATAIRSASAFPGLRLAGVITSSPDKVQGFVDEGIPATTDPAVLLADCDAVAYMASGDIRPDEATADIERCLRAGASVVTPSLYSLYDPTSAPAGLVDRLRAACEAGGSSLLVTGVDPGWANDAMAVLAAGLCTRIEQIRCQEIFDYSTYHQPHAVRVSCGFGSAMEDVPMMLLPTVPTMVWGGNIRLIGRGLGLDIDEITESVERRPLEWDVDNEMGRFDAGSQGAFRLQISGWADGRERVVIDHVTRIHPECAPDWPQPDEGVGDHRIIVDGDPQLTIVVRADVPGGTRADGGNATAVNRLLGAVAWLTDAAPGVYDGLDVPLNSPLDAATARGKVDRLMFLEIPEGSHPIMHVWGDLVPGIGPAASKFSQAVYERGTIELDAFEAARLRMAQINGCLFCNDWRTERDGNTVGPEFAGQVEHWSGPDGDALTTRARLAAEFSERFALDHHGIDDAFWARLRSEFTDAELVELAMCLGSWLSFGRLNRIFGLDAACQLPGHAETGRRKRRTPAVLLAAALAAAALTGCNEDGAAKSDDTQAAATSSTAPATTATTIDPAIPPSIVVTSPTNGAQVQNPFHVLGTSDTFEATVVVTLLDSSGAKLYEQASLATSGTGTPGSFDITVTYAHIGGGTGTLKVWEPSPKDGSETNVVKLNVQL